MQRLLQRKRRQSDVFIHRLLHQYAIFNMRSGSLKSGYRLAQTIYRLPDIPIHVSSYGKHSRRSANFKKLSMCLMWKVFYPFNDAQNIDDVIQ